MCFVSSSGRVKKTENDFVNGVESSKVKPPEKRAIQVIFALSETS